MREFQQRNRYKKYLYSKLVILVLFVLLIMMLRGTFNIYRKEKESRIELQRIEAQKLELEGRFNDIKSKAEHIQADVGIEEEIRKKFDVVKDGEGVIVIVEKELPLEVEAEKKNVLQRFWQSVKGVFVGDKDDKDSVENESGDTASSSDKQDNESGDKSENPS